jgi:hypothetical protein
MSPNKLIIITASDRQHAAAGAVADHIAILGEIQPSHK